MVIYALLIVNVILFITGLKSKKEFLSKSITDTIKDFSIIMIVIHPCLIIGT